jgi:hypothetical protein
MPAYLYQCVHCQAQESRISGLDDHLAICAYCPNLMVRLDLDLFTPYFSFQPKLRDEVEMIKQTA